MMRLLLVLLFCSGISYGQKLKVQVLPSVAEGISFRTVSVVNDSVIWMGGSRGVFCRSINGGISFNCQTVQGYDSTDFRSLYAFDDQTAVMGNTGSPARILRTTDGGISWTVVYENDDPYAFIDGIDFWNDKEGLCFGDPIRNVMMIVRTHDGGITWERLPVQSRPLLVDNEASFAASNTTLRCYDNGRAAIATGSAISRLMISEDKGDSWKSLLPPIIQGTPSTGIFSFDFADENHGIIVGGDHKRDTLLFDHVFYTVDGGKSWYAPEVPTRGYRECVQFISEKTAVAAGPTGIDVTYDGGKNWKALSDEKGFHVIAESRKGKVIVVAGNDGKVGFIKSEK